MSRRLPTRSPARVLADGAQPPLRLAPDFGRLALEIRGDPALIDYAGKRGRRRRR